MASSSRNYELEYIQTDKHLLKIYNGFKQLKHDFVLDDSPYDVKEVAQNLVAPSKTGLVKFFNTPCVEFVAFCRNMSMHGHKMKFVGDLSGGSDFFRKFLRSLYEQVDRKFAEDKSMQSLVHDNLISFKFPMHDITVNGIVRPKLNCACPEKCRKLDAKFDTIPIENKMQGRPCWARILQCESSRCSLISNVVPFARCDVLFQGRTSSLVAFNRTSDDSKGYRLHIECTMAVVIPSACESLSPELYDSFFSVDSEKSPVQKRENKDDDDDKPRKKLKTSKVKRLSWSSSDEETKKETKKTSLLSSDDDEDDISFDFDETPPASVTSDEAPETSVLSTNTSKTMSSLFEPDK